MRRRLLDLCLVAYPRVRTRDGQRVIVWRCTL
jgi:hypothetical protein